MSEMNVRSDAVDVEQIMRQIRARIREKRGVDYTEAEIQQLAKVKLEKFLDPRGVRSDLVDQFRTRRTVSPAPPNYEFGEDTLFETHRGLLHGLRKLFRPLLKLFFNPDKITTALHIQAQVNTQGEQRLRRVEEREPLHYELIHNLTVEVTRLGIEVHNLKMRLESLSSRLDFDERRARSLESVVQYRPQQPQRPPSLPPAQAAGQPSQQAPRPEPAAPAGEGVQVQGPGGERRRRRRRRRRRPGQNMAEGQQGQWGSRGPDGQRPQDHAEATSAPVADSSDTYEADDGPDVADDGGESDSSEQ